MDDQTPSPKIKKRPATNESKGPPLEDNYRWFGNVSPEAQKKITEEIESYIRNGMGRCKCGPLNITAETDERDIYYVARIRCKCGESDFFGDIEGAISIG